MVNHGRSGGCLTCKKRKIKVGKKLFDGACINILLQCDESRPHCRRCRKVGKSCPGYATEWDLSHRDENEKVYAKVHTFQTAVSNDSATRLASHSPTSPSHHPFDISSCHTLSIRCEILSEDFHAHAICLFFRDYVLIPCGICPGWLNFLPDLYKEIPENSALHNAVCATAYANVAQKTRRHELSIKSMLYYRNSIGMLRATLSDNLSASSEATIAAVILLGLYEV